MHAFTDKITHFRWSDLDGKHGSLNVWEDTGEQARLVLFVEDETGSTYVLLDESTTVASDRTAQEG